MRLLDKAGSEYDIEGMQKPQIRLPTDEGPNPYDSRTGYQPPIWMRWQFWLQAVLFGLALYFVRKFF